MGDHGDLPNGQKVLQLRRLHEEQPLEQLDEVIIEIRELMLKSEDTTSREQLSKRKEVAAVGTQRKQQKQQNGADGKLHIFF
jgi:hypothetical protein